MVQAHMTKNFSAIVTLLMPKICGVSMYSIIGFLITNPGNKKAKLLTHFQLPPTKNCKKQQKIKKGQSLILRKQFMRQIGTNSDKIQMLCVYVAHILTFSLAAERLFSKLRMTYLLQP